MNVVFLSIVLVSPFANPLVIPVEDRVPIIDVEETCKAAAATDKAMDRSPSIRRKLHARRECRARAACYDLVDVLRFQSR